VNFKASKVIETLQYFISVTECAIELIFALLVVVSVLMHTAVTLGTVVNNRERHGDGDDAQSGNEVASYCTAAVVPPLQE